MNSENTKILKQLVNQKLKYEDLLEKGFQDDTIIVDTISYNDGMFSKTVFIKKRYYEGLTLEVENNHFFVISSNNLSLEQAEIENHIIDLENEITALDNNIKAYIMEFGWYDQAKILETKKNLLEKRVIEIRETKG
ncbi:hypothetical protein DB895_06370 [Flavobacterium psychrotolerans]|uniref:Uncharacterized protein n=2 Tax=Flavobacterium psychrotolerans TaxID=2169410 RepID=A0A2U1JL54_9FLAO|nr:hypothetical protein DB895_06370 [Flavobacterium psychrotolerans]